MRCLMCDGIKERTGLYDMLWSDDPLCSKCRMEWERRDIRMRFDGISLYAPYVYNDAFSRCLIQYKECMDEALAEVFLYGLGNRIRRMYPGYTVVLMPSAEEKIRERGFHHLKKMFAPLRMPMADPFEKTQNRSQKSLKADERESIREYIRLRPGAVLPYRILLADDTLTSGATMRAALSLIDVNCHKVRCFAVSLNRSQVPLKLPFPSVAAIINKPAESRRK